MFHIISDEEFRKRNGGNGKRRGGRGNHPQSKNPYDLIGEIEAEEKRLKEFKEKIIKDAAEKDRKTLSLSKGTILWMMIATSPIVGISIAMLALKMLAALIQSVQHFPN